MLVAPGARSTSVQAQALRGKFPPQTLLVNMNIVEEIRSIAPLELPSLPIESRKKFPQCSAIYFAIAGDKILYIGRATNLLKRWYGHHRQAELETIEGCRIAWLEVSDPGLLPAIEKALIQSFKPPSNNQCVTVRKPKNSIGRPADGESPKVRVKFTIDVDLYQKLRLEPNKSGLINKLLRQYYSEKGSSNPSI